MRNKSEKPRIYEQCGKAVSFVRSRFPYCTSLLCLRLNRRRVLVFAWDREGGSSRPLRTLDVRSGKTKSIREVQDMSGEYPLSFLYDQYASWCIHRITASDTSKTVCKDHSDVK